MTHQLKDETKYVVIHTINIFYPTALIGEFVPKVEVWDPKTHIYLVSVKCILDPLNVSRTCVGCGKYIL